MKKAFNCIFTADADFHISKDFKSFNMCSKLMHCIFSTVDPCLSDPVSETVNNYLFESYSQIVFFAQLRTLYYLSM